jgi:hypothetical protein
MINAMPALRNSGQSGALRLISSTDHSDYRNAIKWIPNAGPQTDALNCEADELFYGGAAGGGKTDLAIGLALTQHRNSIIFRRVYKNLRGIINRTVEIIGHRDGLNLSSYTWNRLPGERTIEFGAMQQEEDKENYKGNPHDLYVFDEAPDFTESQVTFVTAWKRTTIQGQRTRVLLTGNPPTTTQGEWIVRRYAAWLDDKHLNPAKPGELRWYAMVDGREIETLDGELLTSKPFTHNGELIKPMSRTFIPARLNDNPFLRETSYGSVLQSLPEPLRSQLLYGDFTIGAAPNIYQVVPTDWVRAAQRRWEESEQPDVALRSIGVDVAHGGADKTVISRLFGVWFDELLIFPGKATPDGDTVTAQVDNVWDHNAPIAVDAIGYGASATDTMINWKMSPLAINFGAASRRRDKSGRFEFFNQRAECWWALRDALDPESGEDICLPPSRTLLSDLCAPTFKVVRGKIQLEEKAKIKERLGRSPDEGDAVVLAWRAAQNVIESFELDW